MKAEKNGNRKKRKPAESRGKVRADRVCEQADLTTAAWVAVARLRLRALAEELGRIDALRADPEEYPAAHFLRIMIDTAAFERLVNSIDQAERAADQLLAPDILDNFPDLPAACRDAAVALGFAKEAKS